MDIEVIETQPVMAGVDREQGALDLVAQTREQGLDLVGSGGPLAGLTKQVIETALEEELADPLGHECGEPKAGLNERSRTRAKAVVTEIGPVDIAVHFAKVYSTSISKDAVSRITEKVVEEMAEWQDWPPPDHVYPVVFIDAIVVKVRDSQVTNRPFYAAIGVTTAGECDILGIWAGSGWEGAKYWQCVLTEIKNRGVAEVFIVALRRTQGPAGNRPTIPPPTIHLKLSWRGVAGNGVSDRAEALVRRLLVDLGLGFRRASTGGFGHERVT